MMAAPKMLTYPARALCTGLLALAPVLATAQDFAGLVQPLHDIELSTGVGGVVASKHVRLGSQVRAGQVLMVLDDRLQATEADRRQVTLLDTSELRATEERLRIARTLYDDAKKVFDKTGSISRDELMRLEGEYRATQGRLEQLQALKEREKLEHRGAVQERQMRRLVAPVGGTITKAELEVGEWAKPGEPLIRLVDASTLVFRGNLPMAAVAGLQPGALLPVLVEDGARVAQAAGRLTFISPVADPASGLVEVRANVANPGGRLRAGSKAMLRLGAMPASRQP